MDWSQLGCGATGHVTFAPEEPALRSRLGVATQEGPAWRCLRCGTFVLGEPAAAGAASSAPQVRRGKEVRSALILRIFAVERFIRALIFAALAIAIWRFSASRQSLEESYDHALPPLKTLLRDLGFSVDHSKVLGLINKAFTTDPRILAYLAIGCAAYAAVEVIEGVGLWLVKRWGEYFAMIATSVGLPFEIYDLTNKVTALRAVAFVINLGLVLYLVLTKRLFGARGGKKAYEARLRSESILDAEIAALEAGHQGGPEYFRKPAPAAERGPATEPAPPGDPAPATELAAAAEPATEPAAGPVSAAATAPAEDAPAPAEPSGPAASEAPDADEAGVSALPALPRRHPHS